jgi:hypothetical protein
MLRNSAFKRIPESKVSERHNRATSNYAAVRSSLSRRESGRLRLDPPK